MYSYEKQKPEIFTEAGQKTFLGIRDQVHKLIGEAGCVRMDRAQKGYSGESWFLMACVDRLVELGEIKEVTGPTQPGQYRIFTKYD